VRAREGPLAMARIPCATLVAVGEHEYSLDATELGRIAVECGICKTVVVFNAGAEKPPSVGRCQGCDVPLDVADIIATYRAYFARAVSTTRHRIHFKVALPR
jgi:hypothetical protein